MYRPPAAIVTLLGAALLGTSSVCAAQLEIAAEHAVDAARPRPHARHQQERHQIAVDIGGRITDWKRQHVPEAHNLVAMFQIGEGADGDLGHQQSLHQTAEKQHAALFRTDGAADDKCDACQNTECTERSIKPQGNLTECSPTPPVGLGYRPKISVAGGAGGKFTVKLYDKASPDKQWPTDTCTGIDKCNKPTTCMTKSQMLAGSADKTICAEIGCASIKEDCVLDFSVEWETADVVSAEKTMKMVKLVVGIFIGVLLLGTLVLFCCYRDSLIRSCPCLSFLGGGGRYGKGKGKGKAQAFNSGGDYAGDPYEENPSDQENW